jgi:hypothetical protein
VAHAWGQAVVAEKNAARESASRVAAQQATRSRQLSLPAAAEAAGLARRVTREAVLSWGIAHLQETAVLLVSELVTNVVNHTRTGTRTMSTSAADFLMSPRLIRAECPVSQLPSETI